MSILSVLHFDRDLCISCCIIINMRSGWSRSVTFIFLPAVLQWDWLHPTLQRCKMCQEYYSHNKVLLVWRGVAIHSDTCRLKFGWNVVPRYRWKFVPVAFSILFPLLISLPETVCVLMACFCTTDLAGINLVVFLMCFFFFFKDNIPVSSYITSRQNRHVALGWCISQQ